jgi:Uma2 family endonuclease
VEEYLDLETRARYKSQYYRGEIFARAGASLRHNQIATNVLGELRDRLRGTPCQPLPSDLLIQCPTGLYTYADAIVVCGPPRTTRTRGVDVLLNPQVIFEVLSRSTESFDHTDKFTQYQSIESLKEYVLISQERARVEHFTRGDDGAWRLTIVAGEDATLQFASLSVALPLSAIYERVHVSSVEFIPRAEPSE